MAQDDAGLVESMMARQTHHALMQKAPPAADQDGSLYKSEETPPVGIRGGWKKTG